LFTTLVRFDAVYHGHFKCNLRRLVDYPNLWAYTRALYQRPGIAATVKLDHIKSHYYASHRSINPTGIIPLGPELDFSLPHTRDRLRWSAERD
jgi:putative glutathione S-transferase